MTLLLSLLSLFRGRSLFIHEVCARLSSAAVAAAPRCLSALLLPSSCPPPCLLAFPLPCSLSPDSSPQRVRPVWSCLGAEGKLGAVLDMMMQGEKSSRLGMYGSAILVWGSGGRAGWGSSGRVRRRATEKGHRYSSFACLRYLRYLFPGCLLPFPCWYEVKPRRECSVTLRRTMVRHGDLGVTFQLSRHLRWISLYKRQYR